MVRCRCGGACAKRGAGVIQWVRRMAALYAGAGLQVCKQVLRTNRIVLGLC